MTYLDQIKPRTYVQEHMRQPGVGDAFGHKGQNNLGDPRTWNSPEDQEPKQLRRSRVKAAQRTKGQNGPEDSKTKNSLEDHRIVII